MELQWRDCRVQWDGQELVLGNSRMESRWICGGEGMDLTAFRSCEGEFCWQGTGGETPSLPPPAFKHRVMSSPWQGSGERLELELCWPGRRQILELWPEGDFVACRRRWLGGRDETAPSLSAGEGGVERDDSPENRAGEDVICAAALPAVHLDWQCISLREQSDLRDALVLEQSAPVYPREDLRLQGTALLLRTRPGGEVLAAVRAAPACGAPGGFRLAGGRLEVWGSSPMETGHAAGEGCRCFIGAARDAESLWRSWRRQYRMLWKAPWQSRGRMLSNTWGDRSRDSRVCASFVADEIRLAARLGLDCVQIDDGWQKGRTKNSASPQGGAWGSYYDLDPDFWTPHPQRFPDGLAPLVRLAQSQGVELGLWFSPDSSGEFRHWQRDAETLLGLWRQGIRVFKLDGVNLPSDRALRRYQKLLERVCRESGGQVDLQQDITAQRRMGMLLGCQYGSLFVENRYTDFGNYYPHRTLRNLWSLSRFVPAQRLLMELPNPARNPQNYENDPLAPGRWQLEWLLASVICAQPLFWMELSGLSNAQRFQLAKAVERMKPWRQILWECDIQPVGSMPDGFSVCGFFCSHPAGGGLVLALREMGEQDTLQLDKPVKLEKLLGGPARCGESPRSYIQLLSPGSFGLFRWRA